VRTRFEVTIVGLERQGQIMPVLPQTELLWGDRIFVAGPGEEVKKFNPI
jgi:Trk K+ transport system NAD-binding subunit